MDVAAALDFLEARADVDPSRIAAVGLSMGAEQAISAAGVDDRHRAVVTEGASARAFADLAYIPMDPSGVVEPVVAWETFALADLLTSASQPGSLRDAITQLGSRKPFLIVGDARDERLAAPGFEQAGPSSVERWDLPVVPHIQAPAEHPIEWERRVIGFLERELQP